MLWIVSIFQWEFFMVGINLITGLQPLLGTPEGTEMGCIIFFTSSTMTVYSSGQLKTTWIKAGSTKK